MRMREDSVPPGLGSMLGRAGTIRAQGMRRVRLYLDLAIPHRQDLDLAPAAEVTREQNAEGKRLEFMTLFVDGDVLRERVAGILLGTAIGDALGLPAEGMTKAAIARAGMTFDRYRLFGRTGFVSDDTEQSALVAQSLSAHPRDRDAFRHAFRRALLGWFLRLPWGIGMGTLRACVRIALGLRRSGVASAGNGAAMRAAVVGGFFADATSAERRAWSDTLAEVTHTDARAVQGACFVAELAAQCVLASSASAVDPVRALEAVRDPELRSALERSLELVRRAATTGEAADALGTTGFVVSSVPLATFCFLRYASDPEKALSEAVLAGGDTDTNAAIVGAWLGALHGERGLPPSLVEHLCDGPFGKAHLRALATDLVAARGGGAPTARYSWLVAFARNILLFPVVLVHAVRVLVSRR